MRANHFQLIDLVKNYNTEYGKIVSDLASVENEEKVLKMLELEFYPFFIRERSELITTILRTRFKKIRGI